MAKRVFLTDVYTERGQLIERRTDNINNAAILHENPETGYVIMVESVQLDSGHIQRHERIVGFYTRDDYEFDTQTGRIKLDSKK